MTIPARLGIVTLGVADLSRSVAFYEALGWERCASSSDAIAWFRTADTHIGLFPWHELAEDARSREPGRRSAASPWPSTWTPPRRRTVPRRGRRGRRQAAQAGHRHGLGRDLGLCRRPDGHPWEIAHNPHFPIDAEGRVHIP